MKPFSLLRFLTGWVIASSTFARQLAGVTSANTELDMKLFLMNTPWQCSPQHTWGMSALQAFSRYFFDVGKERGQMLWCGHRPCPPVMPWLNLGENTAWMFHNSKILHLHVVTLRSSCFGMIVMVSSAAEMTFPSSPFSSPSTTSTLSPGTRLTPPTPPPPSWRPDPTTCTCICSKQRVN